MKIVKKAKTYFINYVPEEVELLDKLKDSNLEFNEITSNVYSLVVNKHMQKEENKANPKIDIKKKIISLLNDKAVSGGDKIEGNFEKLLRKEDLSIFQEMLKDKEIIIYHLPKYKKGIYQINTISTEKNASKSTFEKPIKKDFTSAKEMVEETNDIISFFESNGYIIIKNQGDAMVFTDKYSDRVKAGEIIGQKSFDGSYYVIDSDNYKKIKNKLLAFKIKDAFTIDEIKDRLSFPDDEIKVVLEILKEECLVIEKRKSKYLLV